MSIGEIVVEAMGAALEIATDSRSRHVRWAAYAFLFMIFAVIGTVLIVALWA